MIGSGVTRPSSIMRMKRGRSWRMRTLPFWALMMARLCTAIATWGTVTVASARSTLVRTTVPARRDIRIAWVWAVARVAASRT